MKSHNALRRHLLLVGLGATSLLAGSAKAQEITNTQFNDGPYVVPFSHSFTDPASAEATPPAMPVLTEPNALQAMTMIARPATPDHTVLVQAAVVERWIKAILLVAIGIVVFFILVELSMLLELRRRRLRLASSARISTRTA